MKFPRGKNESDTEKERLPESGNSQSSASFYFSNLSSLVTSSTVLRYKTCDWLPNLWNWHHRDDISKTQLYHWLRNHSTKRNLRDHPSKYLPNIVIKYKLSSSKTWNKTKLNKIQISCPKTESQTCF